jgi:nucleoside-diphosphate kinase
MLESSIDKKKDKKNEQENNKLQRTLSIIKPDAVKKNVIGKIIDQLECSGLKIIATKMLKLSLTQAAQFYAVHRERPFFNDLINFISSGPIVVQVLEGVNAVEKNRQIMGATNPQDAAPGTIRKNFAESIDHNAVHGSDSLDNAKIEIAFFFADYEIVV